jgi:hypothetical protein
MRLRLKLEKSLEKPDSPKIRRFRIEKVLDNSHVGYEVAEVVKYI